MPVDVNKRLAKVRRDFAKAEEKCRSAEDAETVRTKFLGRAGTVRKFFTAIGKLPKKTKGGAGKSVNELKKELEKRVEELAGKFKGKVEKRAGEDISVPGTAPEPGRRHPMYRTWDDIVRVFLKLGFDVEYGPEVESEFNNFEALNIPLEHPSRDGFDTFYIEGGEWLLRSHTSPVQIRTMKRTKPPIRIIAPGKTFRPDKPDASHSPMFHQVEGLMVGEDVTFAHLKGVLELFAKSMWSEGTKVRFRPSFFPFTEPSAEVDISCFLCDAKGCPACKRSGWMEILGSGMVHPRVLENCGIDSEKYTGFAFGMGIERICMLKYGIPDIRLLVENHFGFLRQF